MENWDFVDARNLLRFNGQNIPAIQDDSLYFSRGKNQVFPCGMTRIEARLIWNACLFTNGPAKMFWKTRLLRERFSLGQFLWGPKIVQTVHFSFTRPNIYVFSGQKC